MKIGFDAKRAFFNFRGLGNYSRTLIEGLSSYYPENELYLYSPCPKSESVLSLKESINCKNRFPESLLGKLIPSYWRRKGVISTIQKDHLDLFHGLSHELPIGIESLNIKKIVTIHDLLFMKFPRNFSIIDRWIYKRKFNHSILVADKIVAISEQTKVDMISLLNVPEDKIEVLYQSCHPRFYEKHTKESIDFIIKNYQIKSKYVFYFGALSEGKNILHLIRSFAEVTNVKKEINLVLAGRGSEKYLLQIKTLISELGIGEKVLIITDVKDEDAPFLYQGAELFVFPSHYEGFGIPIIEAHFSGVPVITSTGSCFSESGGPGALYVDSNDQKGLVDAMIKVLSDPAKKEVMVTISKEFVSKFHLKKTSQVLLDFYKKLLLSN